MPRNLSTDPGTDSLGRCAVWVGECVRANGNGRSTWRYICGLGIHLWPGPVHFDLDTMIGGVGASFALVTGRSIIVYSVSPRPVRASLFRGRGDPCWPGGLGDQSRIYYRAWFYGG